MKLSFSTLGCPDWSLREILAIASDLGYNGIEIRGIADEIYAPKVAALQGEALENTMAKLKRAGLSVPILTSGAYIADNPDSEASEFEIKDYVMLASKMGVKYVRIMGEKTPGPNGTEQFDLICEKYKEFCEFAQGFGIDLLIETNGILADSKRMKTLMEKTGAPNMGVLWDIHHTYRFFDETPAETVGNLGKWIKHVHVKDSVKGRNGAITYMLNGYGDVPIDEAYRELKSIGYDGYYSYEWVKRWSRELAEPGVAFFKYLSYMRELSGNE